MSRLPDKHVRRFGRWAQTYDSSRLQRIVFEPLQQHTLEQAAMERPQPASILDIGCGTGALLRRAAHRFPGADLVGVDAAPEMIRVARTSAPPGLPVRFVHAFAEELPFDDASFDLVLTTMSFHHWRDQPVALHEVRRVLRSDGAFILTDAVPADRLRRLFALQRHGRFPTVSALALMACMAGLRPRRLVSVPGFGNVVRVAVARARDRVPVW